MLDAGRLRLREGALFHHAAVLRVAAAAVRSRLGVAMVVDAAARLPPRGRRPARRELVAVVVVVDAAVTPPRRRRQCPARIADRRRRLRPPPAPPRRALAPPLLRSSAPPWESSGGSSNAASQRRDPQFVSCTSVSTSAVVTGFRVRARSELRRAEPTKSWHRDKQTLPFLCTSACSTPLGGSQFFFVRAGWLSQGRDEAEPPLPRKHDALARGACVRVPTPTSTLPHHLSNTHTHTA